jgi:putative tricarboxylic transport membrane protein
MKSIKGDVWLALCAFALAAVYLYMDLRLPEVRLSDPLGPKAFPALVGVGLVASALLLLLESRAKARTPAHEPLSTAPTNPTPPGKVDLGPATARGAQSEPAHGAQTPPEKKAHPLILVAMVAWTSIYYLVFERAGYLIATAVFLFGLLAYFNRKRLTTNLAIALGVTVVFDLLFSQLLGVPLPTGFLPF